MDRFEAMRALVAAVDGGSLSAASRSLNVPLPTISRRVSDLERLLGSQLVVRTSRKLLLTEAGTAYLASARRVLDELAEAERAASGEYRAPRGELLVTAPIAFGVLYVAPIIHEFLAVYADVTVRLVLSDGIVDLVEDRVDVAIRIGHLPDSALLARAVGEIRWVVCASPAYLTRRGRPNTPSELTEHDCIVFEGLPHSREWSFIAGNTEQVVTIKPRFSVSTAEGVIAAALAGVGIARVLSYQAVENVRTGALLPLLDDRAPGSLPVHLVHAPHQQQPLKLRAFLDFAAPLLQQRLRAIAGDIAGAGQRIAGVTRL